MLKYETQINVEGQGLEKENIYQEVTIKDLLDAGAHFGHQKRRWNPKMKKFIFEVRKGLIIIDLAKTLQLLRKAIAVVEKTVIERRPILFVGTKKQAKAVIRESAESAGEYYVCERWLGGMLTNMSTIRQSIKTLDRVEKKISAGEASGLTKKELTLLTKEQLKLEKNLSGVRALRKLPGLIIVVDPTHEHIAVAEARKLKIPVMALVDTNCDPDPIQYPIPCNDDALKSIKLIVQSLSQSIVNKKNELKVSLETEEEEEVASVDRKKDADLDEDEKRKR